MDGVSVCGPTGFRLSLLTPLPFSMIFFKKVINLTRDNWYGLHLLTNSSNLPVPDNPHRQLFDRELFFPGFHIYKWSNCLQMEHAHG